jgi:hypothetical protein
MLKVEIVVDQALHGEVAARVRKALASRAYEVQLKGGREVIPPSELQRGQAHRATEADPDKGQFRIEDAERAVILHWTGIQSLRETLMAALAGLKYSLRESPMQQEAESLFRHAQIQDRDSQQRAAIVRQLRETGFRDLADELEGVEPADGSSAKPIGKV